MTAAFKDLALYGGTDYPRTALDYYPTLDTRVVPALLEAIEIRGPIWEPAAGGGHMARALAGAGFQVTTSDLVDHTGGAPSGMYLVVGADFLKCRPSPVDERLIVTDDDLQLDGYAGEIASIVTNPPYAGDLALRFCEQALRLMRPRGGMVAILLRLDWSAAGSPRTYDGRRRRALFDDPAFAAKVELTFRPKWIEKNPAAAERPDQNQKDNGPRHSFAWHVWDCARDLDAPPPAILYSP